MYKQVTSPAHYKDNHMKHIVDRLNERNIQITPNQIVDIAQKYISAAIILQKSSHVGQEGAYRTRTESNGDLVVLIVRNRYPVTIMYRRSNQPATPEALHVMQVVDITQ